jgi:hypothetical protein
MAEMMKRTKTLKHLLDGAPVSGSSIVEVIVATLIFSIVFGIAMMIGINLQVDRFSLRKTLYQEMLRKQYREVIRSRKYEDLTTDAGAVKIIQHIKPYGDSKTLLWVNIEAVSAQGKVVSVFNGLIHDPKAN